VAKVEIGRVYGAHQWAPDQAVLVDRLWPRGIRKDEAPFGIWLKEAAPSPELRKWYGHVPERFPEFARRYRIELRAEPTREAFKRLQELSRAGPVVLVTATKDLDISGAAVLRDVLASGAGS
jgi:uncharacterized protein YeaO (DUF488 family)